MYCPLPTIHDDLETLRTRLRQTRDAEQKQRKRYIGSCTGASRLS